MASAPLLLVVDVQRGFVNESSSAALPAIVDLVNRWQELGGRVVATRFRNSPGSQWVRLLDWPKFIDSSDYELVDELDDADLTVVDKYSYTSLTDEVADLLPDPPSPVFVCGIDTDICVTKTAVDLFERGNRPVVITDACASHAGPEAHAAGLATLRRFIGRRQLLTCDEATAAVTIKVS